MAIRERERMEVSMFRCLMTVLVLVFTFGSASAQQSLTYLGVAADPTDPRVMDFDLTFSPAAVAGVGDGVSGTLNTPPVCVPRTAFGGNWIGGGNGAISASVRGSWEGRASIIRGTWSGDNLLCPPGAGAPVLEAATAPLCVFMAPARNHELFTIARVFDPNGQHVDYALRPKSQTVAQGVEPTIAAAPRLGPVRYDRGRGWIDGREFRMEATFQGSRVVGNIRITPFCSETQFLPGGELTFEATASGGWEVPGTEILGFYGGQNVFCDGRRQEDFGTILISLGDGPDGSPAVRFQLATEVDAGEQSFFHAPLGQQFSAVAGTPAPDPFYLETLIVCELPIPTGLRMTRPVVGPLPRGPFPVVVNNAGTVHTAMWTLEVNGNLITGMSEWDGNTSVLDPLQGEIVGDEVAIVRDCRPLSGLEKCSQVYVGKIGTETIDGTWSGTGARPTGSVVWQLDLTP